jgi:hypothetical protein
MTASSQIEWPSGEFQWTDELRAQLPIMRGVRVPEFKLPDDPYAELVAVWGDEVFRDSIRAAWALLVSSKQASRDLPWTDAEALHHITREALARKDLGFWRELVLQAGARSRNYAVERNPINCAVQAAMALHSLAFAFEVILDIGWREPWIFRRAHVLLRHAVAAAPQEQYLAARTVAEGFRGRELALDALICYLFPEMGEWAEAYLLAQGDRIPGLPAAYGPWLSGWMSETTLPVESACRFSLSRPMVLLQIRLHGEAAWPLLERELDEAHRHRHAAKVVKLVCRMWTPALIPALAARMDHKDVSAELARLAAKWPAAVLKTVMDRAVASRSRTLEAWAAGLAARRPRSLDTVLAVATEAERERYARAFTFLAPSPEEALPELVPEALRAPLPPEAENTKLPDFFRPAALRRPRLRNGQVLPNAAIERLGRLLAASTLQEPRPELAEVKAACTAESLAEFAWDVFEAWQAAGSPNKVPWGLTSLGLLGDGSTARRLVPKIRDWRKNCVMARASWGLDTLAAIHHDAALMYLHGIIGKPIFKGLRDKARAKIAEIAEARDLSPEELADRLAPDLGLDDGGTLELDFGPRRFHVSFDEALKPYVRNAEGARLKDLPKPNKSDDDVLAQAALARFRELKKDAKAVAALQIARLEQNMCARRRWNGEEFGQLFLNHPLMRHLARRLVWGVYRDGALADAFRVAEDATLADRRDDLYAIPDGVGIGIVHALELPEDLGRDFGQIFADYEILQPFKQLGRETYALIEAERQNGKITRFEGKQVSSGGIMGLIGRGWEWGSRESYPYVDSLYKRLADGLGAELWISPGIDPSDPRSEPVQEIRGLAVLLGYQRVDIASLDPILVSELIRDVDLLAAVNN